MDAIPRYFSLFMGLHHEIAALSNWRMTGGRGGGVGSALLARGLGAKGLETISNDDSK